MWNKKLKCFQICLVACLILFFLGHSLAEEIDNSIELSVNPGGDYAENTYYIDSTNNIISFDWEEKAFYGVTKDNEDSTIHPKFTVTNVGDESGKLYVKIELLSYSGNPETFWLHFKDQNDFKVLDLESKEASLTDIFKPDESITIFDFIAIEEFHLDFPILISTSLVNRSGEIIGFDTEIVFFNTDLKNYMQTGF